MNPLAPATTIRNAAGVSDPTGPRPDVRIVHLTAVAFRALAAGDVAAAEAESPVPLSAY